MSLRAVVGDVVLAGPRGVGTHQSPAISTGGSVGVADIMVGVHVTAASGTSPTLTVSVEQSQDGASWSAVPGSAAQALTAVGNTVCNATTTQQFARVVAVIGGTTPNFTFRAAVLVFGE